jgi:hypothetical protein
MSHHVGLSIALGVLLRPVLAQANRSAESEDSIPIDQVIAQPDQPVPALKNSNTTFCKWNAPDTRRSAMCLKSLVLTFATAALSTMPCAGQLVFEPPLVSGGQASARTVILGDLNGDGLVDAVVAHEFVTGQLPTVSLGLGGGLFGAPELLAGLELGHVPRRLADLNADGHLDLLVSGLFVPPKILLGDGRGGFGPPAAVGLPLAVVPADADLLDFDGNGLLDVASLNLTHVNGPGSVAVSYGNGDGSFAPATVLLTSVNITESAGPGVLRAGDTNGDGLPEIVYATIAGAGVIRSNGGGAFSTFAWPCLCAPLAPLDFELVDLDGNGRDDILSPTRALLSLPGHFSETQTLAQAAPHLAVASADLDGDGLLDALIARGAGPVATQGSLLLLRGQGNGSFELPGVVVSPVTRAVDVAVGDVDLDGRADAVVAGGQGAAAALAYLRNHTYLEDSPFLDLGGGLGSSAATPIQLADGTLLPGEPFSFALAHGPSSGAAFLVVGFSALMANFKGGTLVPFPHLFNGPFATDPSGGVVHAGAWPSGASGLTLWLQFWMPSAAGPVGFVASSGVRAEVP